MNAPAGKAAKKDSKPKATPAEERAALGLPESATDAEVKAALKVSRFKNVAGKRTNRALEAMSNLERCANKANYTYTPEQVQTIMVSLSEQLERLSAAFSATTNGKPHVEL